ncbi:hypothetical protein [Streptacidiphilus cavernicola]|uniref:Uncharacterized protein n=1 Tax=Streptacidiphilus cavernicola TaxID=3342716 RepID=A0ABV6VZI9_9ACTN
MVHPLRPDPRDRDAERWLRRHKRSLSGLDTVLDTGAGLREILLQGRHDTALDALDVALDGEAGLAAILSASPPASTAWPYSIEAGSTSRQSHAVLSPEIRLALRADPGVAAAYRALVRDGDPCVDLDLDLVSARVHDLARDLDRALGLARDLDQANGLADDLAAGLDRASALACDLVRIRARGQDRAFERSRDFELSLARDLAFAVACDLAHDLDAEDTSDLARDLDLDRALTGALDLVRHLHRDADRVRARDLELADIRTGVVRRAIGAALDREPPALSRDSVHTFLNDFTTSDLGTVDLAGIDLGGVRWSESGTRWPTAVDVENLKRQSAEILAGSRIWVVRTGTATLLGGCIVTGGS